MKDRPFQLSAFSSRLSPGPRAVAMPYQDEKSSLFMDNSATKAQLLERVRQERAAWEALLGRIGTRRMTEPGAMGDWTFKDLIAHMTAWRQRELDGLAAAHQHRPAPPARWVGELGAEVNTDAINEWIYRANRDRSLADILAESGQSFEQLERLVAEITEDELRDPARLAWIDGEVTLKHFHDEHEASLRSWLEHAGN